MSNQYWVDKDATGLFSDADAWGSASGVEDSTGPPGAGDKAIFDAAAGNPQNNCRLDVSITVGEIETQAGYTGTVDGATDNLNHEVTDASGGNGDMILDGTQITMGGGKWTVRGNFDNEHTLMASNSGEVELTGASKILTSTLATNQSFYSLTISGSITTGGDGFYVFSGSTLDNSGTITVSSGDTVRVSFSITITNSGIITGLGKLAIDFNCKITVLGTINVATLQIRRPTQNPVLVAGQYDSATVSIEAEDGGTGARTFKFAAGTTTFTGHVTFSNDPSASTKSLIVDNTANNPTLIFQGDVAIEENGAGTVTWTRGANTITLNGSNNQDLALLEKEVEDLEIDKPAGTVTVIDSFTTDSFAGTDGTLNPNGKTITVTGGMDWASGFVIADPVGSTFVVGGNFTANAQDISGASGEWFLKVSGTAVASGVGDVAHSNAGGFTEIDASVGPWADSGNNTNWNFGVAAGNPWYHYANQAAIVG
jgi:hypothetical protein